LTASNWKPYVVLAFGLLAVSTAAIFIRFSQNVGTTSLVVASGRMVVASAVLLPLALRQYRDEFRELTRGDLSLAGLSGVVLGLHFATWITSLEYTSVVNSVVLVTTNPLWVAVLAPFFLKETMRRRTLVGLALAFAGGVLVALSGETGDPPTRSEPLLGNGLAVIGALAAALYFMVGRRLRAHLSVIPYITLVYSISALTLLTVTLVVGELSSVMDLPAEAFLWLLLLGLVPQLLGHSSFNYALGYLPAGYVSLVVLGEPIGSGVLAMIFLGENPVPLQLLGAAFILGGIFVATREQFRRQRRVAPAIEQSIPPQA
jgi:drug/metabolite transporter (DMT)-like permease